MVDGTAADGSEASRGVNVVQRCVGRGVVCAEVKNAACKGEHGTCGGVVGAAVADAFAPNAVLLGGEGEIDGGGRGNVGKSAGPGSAEKCDIAETKRGAVDTRVGWVSVFAGTAEEKETNEGHVTHGTRPGVDGVAVDMLQEL